MGIRKILATTAMTVMVASGAVLVGASPASADQVWNQSIGRASADAACPTSDAADLDAGWSEWMASWELWANDGTGGYVCSRSITWAKDSPPSGDGCVQGSPFEWLDFLGGWSLPFGSPLYADVDCSVLGGTAVYDIVYATDGAEASARCIAVFGTDEDLTNFGYPVWGCKLYDV